MKNKKRTQYVTNLEKALSQKTLNAMSVIACSQGILTGKGPITAENFFELEEETILEAATWLLKEIPDIEDETKSIFETYRRVGKECERLGSRDYESTSMKEFIKVYSFASVMKNGTNHFSATRPFFQKMLLSDVKIQYKDIRLPYRSFVIELPSLRGSEKRASGDVRIVTVSRANDVILMTFYLLHKNSPTGMSLCAVVSEDPDTKYARAELVQPWDPKNPMDVAAKIAYLATEYSKTVIGISTYISMGNKGEKRAPQGIEKAKRTARNKCLSAAEREKAIKRLESLRLYGSPYVVGSKVTIDDNLKKVAQEELSGKRTIDTASYVRGHIRNQACGPQRSERKSIWIEPHWRGLEASKVSQKTYKVK